MQQVIRVGTRGSVLARWQADWVTNQLRNAGANVEIVTITTQGDAQQSGPIGAIGSQGVFTKEIQQALLDDRVDVAVHSLKDLPTEVIPELALVAVPPREEVGDALISRVSDGWEDLPQGAKIGTGSARRKAQLLNARPDLQVEDIRGNVDTRLKKLADGQYDAIILAQAGLKRLELDHNISEVLPFEVMIPAVGQAALGIEMTQSAAAEMRDLVRTLNHAPTESAALAERALLAGLRGGCLAPVGARARFSPDDENLLEMDAVVLSSDGQKRLVTFVSGSGDAPTELGQQAADELLSQGAAELIAGERNAD